MYNKNVRINSEVDELLAECVRDFLTHHPEMKGLNISYNKIIYETAKFYLKH